MNAVSEKSLPSNKATLEILLAQVNRGIEWLEPLIASQRYKAQHLEKAVRDRYSILPDLGLERSVRERMRLHTVLGGPSNDLLAGFIDQEALNKIGQNRQAAAARLSSIARGQITDEHWAPAAAAILQVADADSAFVGLLKTLRDRIMIKLESSESAAPRATFTEDSGADTKQKKSPICDLHLPENPEVLRLAAEIQKKSGAGISQRQVAIEFTEGDRRKADSLLRQLRRFPNLLE